MGKVTAQDLEKLLAEVTQGEWVADDLGGMTVTTSAECLPARRTDGYGCGNDFICDLNDGEYHEYSSPEEQQANATLIALAPSLARRAIAAEKLAEAASVVLERGYVSPSIEEERGDHDALKSALAAWEAAQ